MRLARRGLTLLRTRRDAGEFRAWRFGDRPGVMAAPGAETDETEADGEDLSSERSG